MPSYRATVAYDGSGFQGWQLQTTSARTVQGELEAALTRLAGGTRVTVAGSGRTDTGVHALGQVALFFLERSWAPAELQRALNTLLPVDVAVMEASLAPPGFHPRKSALSKLYRYEIDNDLVQLPTRRRYAAHVPYALDRDAMQAVAALYLGRHDFASLANTGSSVTTTVRTVTRSDLRCEGGTVVFETEADGFLRKMVRAMVGGLLAAGRGAVTPAALTDALAACDRTRWPAPAPARGLFLVRVSYAPAAETPTDAV